MLRSLAILNAVGLAFTVVAAVLLVFAMPLERTNYRLIETRQHEVAICFNDRLVVAGYGGPLVVGPDPCPDSLASGVAPVIRYEHPTFVSWALWLLLVGFVFQLPAALRSIAHP